MLSRRIFFWGLVLAAATSAGATPALGQRLRLSQNPSGAATFPAPVTPIQPGATQGVTPIAPPTYDPGFDPYSSQGSAPPALLGPPTVLPGAGTTVDPFSGSTFGPAYPGTQPPTLFPGGACAPPVVTEPPLKLFQNIRIEGTYIYDDPEAAESLQITEWEAATTLAIPNFAYSGQPILVSPGFNMNLWSGPRMPGINADLPPQVYGGWVDLGWFPNSRFASQVSYELTGRIGVYSDFEAFSVDSYRPQGTALIKLRVTPTLTAKAGVEYINRADIKLLPAGGFLWTPNAHTRWDIYFPRPKLATYFTTLGNTEFWWYLGGEYGGDTWTIEPEADPIEQRVTYNDFRAALGIEWYNPYGAKGFIEGGYVFEREVIYTESHLDNFNPDNTFLIRAGLAY